MRKIAKFRPDFVAIEPPELIGKGKAVSKVKPKIISMAVKIVRNITRKTKVLCGAGISSGEDVKKALELGSAGVLVSSAFVKAKNPKKILNEFLEAI